MTYQGKHRKPQATRRVDTRETALRASDDLITSEFERLCGAQWSQQEIDDTFMVTRDQFAYDVAHERAQELFDATYALLVNTVNLKWATWPCMSDGCGHAANACDCGNAHCASHPCPFGYPLAGDDF